MLSRKKEIGDKSKISNDKGKINEKKLLSKDDNKKSGDTSECKGGNGKRPSHTTRPYQRRQSGRCGRGGRYKESRLSNNSGRINHEKDKHANSKYKIHKKSTRQSNHDERQDNQRQQSAHAEKNRKALTTKPTDVPANASVQEPYKKTVKLPSNAFALLADSDSD